MSRTLSRGERNRQRSATSRAKRALRDLRSQLGILHQQVSAKVDLKGLDLDCLDIIGRHGPLSPSELSRRTGIHPATLTGILDRLEKNRWVARRRDPEATDRRTVLIHALTERSRELLDHYAGMNTAMDQLCADYSSEELTLITEFLRRTTAAGAAATGELSAAPSRREPAG